MSLPHTAAARRTVRTAGPHTLAATGSGACNRDGLPRHHTATVVKKSAQVHSAGATPVNDVVGVTELDGAHELEDALPDVLQWQAIGTALQIL